MPDHLQRYEIDWNWSRLPEAERAVVRRHEARAQADPGAHTLPTLVEALAAASLELRGREIRAKAEDHTGEHALVARDGQCREVSYISLDPEGRFPDRLGADDYRSAGVEKLCVALFWPDGMIGAIEAQAARLDRSLSWVVERAWALAKSSTSPPAGEDGLARDGVRRKQSIYLSIEIYAELGEIAAREDCSMSSVIHRALAAAWPTITTLSPES